MNDKYELSKEQLEAATERKLNKRNNVIEEYVLRGRLLKQVGEDIQPFLPGVVCGLAAEVVSEESVIVYKLDRTSGVKAVPFLSWKSGEVTKRSSTRGMNLEYVIPEGRSKGLFLSKANKVCVPLQA